MPTRDPAQFVRFFVAAEHGASSGNNILSKMGNYRTFRDLWVECRDGTIGCVSEIDKAGYCILKDINGAIVKGHEPINKLKTENEDFAIYLLGTTGKRRH